MHIALHHVIEQGDLYYVAFPKWRGTFQSTDDPAFDWHKTSVIQVNPNTPISDPFPEEPRYTRVDKIPFGSMAYVLMPPGEGPDAQEVARIYSRGPDREVFCFVTNGESGHSFLAVVGVTELWEQDPRTSRP